ncbi:MAG: hypothetical protein AAF456_12780 [Planctomycetota bacterium]
MKLMKLSFVMAICVAAFAGTTNGDNVLYEQTLDPNADSWLSELNIEQEVDDITVAGSTTWTSVTWYGHYSGGPLNDDFSIRLFNDIAGTPGINPIMEENVGAVSRVDTGLDDATSGMDIYEYTSLVGNFNSIGAGDYHFSIVNNTGVSWEWSGHDNTVGGHFRAGDGQAWIAHNFPSDFAFRINAIPEPASTALILGLAVPAICIRRRK